MSKFLVVRDRKTGKKVTIATSSIPREIQPDEWFENGYWRYRPDKGILEPVMKDYLEGKELSPYEVRCLASYIVDYACHIAVMGYLFAPDNEGYRFNVECIRRLRDLAEKAFTRDDICEMILAGRDYALDPL